MSQYEIKRWDVVMTGNNTFKSPIIYIKPDLDFLEFARSNNFAVMAVVEGTGLQYDGNQIPSVINTGCTTPNCRPNMSDATGYYVISLDSNWYGYPKNGQLGTVSFLGLNKPKLEAINKKQPKKQKSVSRSVIDEPVSKQNEMSNKNIIIIIFGLILLLIIVINLAKVLCKN